MLAYTMHYAALTLTDIRSYIMQQTFSTTSEGSSLASRSDTLSPGLRHQSCFNHSPQMHGEEVQNESCEHICFHKLAHSCQVQDMPSPSGKLQYPPRWPSRQESQICRKIWRQICQLKNTCEMLAQRLSQRRRKLDANVTVSAPARQMCDRQL